MYTTFLKESSPGFLRAKSSLMRLYLHICFRTYELRELQQTVLTSMLSSLDTNRI